MRASAWRAGVVAPCLALAVSAGAVGAGTASAAPTTTPFCSRSTTLVKDLFAFGNYRTNAAIVAALTKVDKEFAALNAVAPTRQTKATISTLRTEFAQLKKIVQSDPNATKPADAAFVRGFRTNAAKQGLALGAEIKAACSK